MPVKRRDSDSSQEEGAEGEEEVFVRQDLYVVFTHERELRNVDQVKIKISQFTGVVMRLKHITPQAMENLLAAIEADAITFQQQQQVPAALVPMRPRVVSQPGEMGGLAEKVPMAIQTPTSGIINLRFEECVFASKAVQLLKMFLSQKQLIETFFIQKVEFQDPVADFRLLVEGLQFSIKIRKVGVLGMLFDEEPYGKTLCHLLNDCRQLKEFDASGCEFFHPKCFFDMCQSLINEKSRVIILKLKGIHISNLEGKVLQFVLMKNKSLHTLDLSNVKVDSGECLEFFLQKLDKYSNIRYLIMDSIQPDLSNSLEILGEALSENIKLEVLIMRENKLKWVPYSNFWDNLRGNVSLQKINVSKTDLSDRVLEKMCTYLVQADLKLVDLDLSRNTITDVGLQNLSEALLQNTTIKYLNLSQNSIRDVGLKTLVNYLSLPECTLVELSLMGNKVNNEGIHILSEFIRPNKSLKMLDISKNSYGDSAFQTFAQEMGATATLTFLDISKSKDLNDEGSLITLARQLALNTHLQTLDLTSVRVRKPFLKMYMEPSLQKNITLKYVLGKLTPDIIDEQLNINIQIQTDVEPNFQEVYKVTKHTSFDVRLVDPDCNSILQMRDQNSSLFDAAFKFMQRKDVRQIDFSNMDLQDGQLYQIADYLKQVPNLRSLVLNGNKQITDDGIIRIASSLRNNNKLAHLAITACPLLSDECLQELLKVLTHDNMMMCLIEFDEGQYEQQLGKDVKRETVLNRAIQENLKPSFFNNSAISTSAKKKPQELSPRGSEGEDPYGRNSQSHEEVAFMEGAPVHKYISSAIKCWRITCPIVIQIENQQLNDKHVVELCEFLRNREMIYSLNLRRNHISNVGALALIDWITNNDNTLNHLDVSRNRITRAGAAAFLTAMKKLTRIIDFQIAYGNPIPLDISLAIGYEVVANNQIKANQDHSSRANSNVNTKVTLTNSRYELIDRGPIYMRCAIKSVELLKIQHLSLPDNMLGLEEAKMLADMIKMNPPLKTLNLETNNLDAQCGKLIADALYSNDNLQILNISKNLLSDIGINFLLQSLVKSRLVQIKDEKDKNREKAIEEAKKENTANTAPENTAQPQIGKQAQQKGRVNLKLPIQQIHPLSPRGNKRLPLQGKQQKQQQFTNSSEREQEESNRRLATEDIEQCNVGQLKILNIMENQTTLECYKVVSTLLQINDNVVIYFDSPLQMQQQRKKKQEQLQQKRPQSPTIEKLHEDSQAQLLKDGMMSSRTVVDIENPQTTQTGLQSKLESLPSLEDSKAEESDSQQDIIVKRRSPCMSLCMRKHDQRMQKMTKCCSVLCCYTKTSLENMGSNEEPTLGFVCCWRVHKWKQTVSRFIPEVEPKTSFNLRSRQNGIVGIMCFNQILLYIFLILPFVVPREDTGIFVDGVLAAFIGYLWFFEIIAILSARSTVKVNLCNFYLGIQIWQGLLNKAAIVCVGHVGSLCFQTREIAGIVFGCLALLMIAIDQYQVIRLSIQAIKQQGSDTSGSVMPFVERSQKVTEVLGYRGLLIMFRKITLLPSKHSETMAQKIACDLNPDLIKAPATGFFPKLYERLKISYCQHPLKRHLFFIDTTLLVLIVLCFACGWIPIDLRSISILACACFMFADVFASCLQMSYEQTQMPQVSLDSGAVFDMGNMRNLKMAPRYQSVLMRVKEPKTEKEQLKVDTHHSEASLFETKGSAEREQPTLGHGVSAPDLSDKLQLIQPVRKQSNDLEMSLVKEKTLVPGLSITQEVGEATIEVIEQNE